VLCPAVCLSSVCYSVVAKNVNWGNSLLVPSHSLFFFRPLFFLPLFFLLSLFSPFFPFPGLLFLFFSLEVGPLNFKFSSAVWGEPQPKSNLVHSSFKICDAVATTLIIFRRINWPNWQFCAVYRRTYALFGGLGGLGLPAPLSMPLVCYVCG